MPTAKTIHTIPQGRTRMPEQDPLARGKNFDEVALGYAEAQALREAERCLECKKPRCISGCPVGIDIPGFIRAVGQHDFQRAYEILRKDNPLPAVCGRVCPQEQASLQHFEEACRLRGKTPAAPGAGDGRGE